MRAAIDTVVAGGSITVAVGIWFQWFQMLAAVLVGIGTVTLLILRIITAIYDLRDKKQSRH